MAAAATKQLKNQSNNHFRKHSNRSSNTRTIITGTNTNEGEEINFPGVIEHQEQL